MFDITFFVISSMEASDNKRKHFDSVDETSDIKKAKIEECGETAETGTPVMVHEDEEESTQPYDSEVITDTSECTSEQPVINDQSETSTEQPNNASNEKGVCEAAEQQLEKDAEERSVAQEQTSAQAVDEKAASPSVPAEEQTV